MHTILFSLSFSEFASLKADVSLQRGGAYLKEAGPTTHPFTPSPGPPEACYLPHREPFSLVFGGCGALSEGVEPLPQFSPTTYIFYLDAVLRCRGRMLVCLAFHKGQ